MNKLGLPVQPYIIVVGPTLQNIKSFYVSIDKILYQLPSALKAIDICFKAFHTFNALYPPEAEHIWYLIQSGLYKFKTKWDKQVSYVMDIVNSIQ
ncbi:uncharacterized protein LOC125501492 [Athalia rosae]|uniref:uncharacterized protein LOC125501492 n=1 Tax=Athalia rosae TaxID=37344 RepID=UPI002033EDFC|nr:uncharacterized protein LOC125501492 [Athalia rosae]